MTQALTATGPMVLDGRLPKQASPSRPRVDDQAESASQHVDRRRAAWMAAAQNGDRVAYERVLADSVGLIRAVAQARGVPAAQLDDVVQETLLTVHRVRHTYDPSRSYQAWLAAIAARRAIDALRRHGRREHREVHDQGLLEGYADGVDAAAGSERAQQAERLRRAIAELPPGQREAVEQLGLHERTLAEAAAHTGRSTGALKVNLHRALKALRVRLKGED
jgi:RNA polymerase sigma-70 factor (ECF subfamily)